MACVKCSEYGGLWQMTTAGLRRCDCEEAKRVADLAMQRENPIGRPPVLVGTTAAAFVEMLAGAMKFTPGDGLSRSLIAEEIRSMCHDDQDAMWLVKRMARLYTDWPGVKEMRRAYCASGRIPLDGLIDESPSEIYGGDEGIPPERHLAASSPYRIPEPPVTRRLAEGQKHEVIIEDTDRAQAIQRTAAKMPKMPAARAVGSKFEQVIREIETAPQDRPELPGPTPQIITQEDIQRAVAELHEKRKENQENGNQDLR